MRRLSYALACVAMALTEAHRTNPIEKALHMISNLQAMVLSQAGDAQKTYNRYAAYCEERSQNINYAIKTEKGAVSSLKAAIKSNTAAIGVLTAKIQEVSEEIHSSDGDLVSATALRDKEAGNFAREEQELSAIVESLKRAISIFSKQDGMALLQMKGASSITDALDALVEGSAMTAEDAFKLTSMVQEQHTSKSEGGEDEDDAAIDLWTQNSQAFLQKPAAAGADGDSKAAPFGVRLPPGVKALPPPAGADPLPPPPGAISPGGPIPGGPIPGGPIPGGPIPGGPIPGGPIPGGPIPGGPIPGGPIPGGPIPGGPVPLYVDPFADMMAASEAAAKAAAAVGAPPLAGGIGNMNGQLGDPASPPSGAHDPQLPPIGLGAPGAPAAEGDKDPFGPYAEEEKHAPTPSPPEEDDIHFSPSPPVYKDIIVPGGPSPTPSPTPSFLRPRASPQNVDIRKPKSKAYQRQSSSIVATLQSLLAKAETHLDNLQGAESSALQNYKMLKSSLLQGIDASKEEMAEAKASLPEKKEAKYTAEGDLEATSKDLKGDTAGKEALHHQCLTAAEEFQAAVLTHNEEMKALATAKKAIEDTTGGAAAQAYVQESDSQASLVQLASRTRHDGAENPQFKAIRFLRDLGTKLGSTSLTQLASKMSSAVQFGTRSDPFAKVKDLIENMIAELNSEADSDSALKAYCDRELSATSGRKEDSGIERDRLNTRTAQKKARSAKLRGDISTLRRELAALAASLSVANEIRQDEHRAFAKDKTEMEQGLNGIRLALKVLKEHYGHDAQSSLLTQGASGGIIPMLEVVESDFTKGLAELIVTEETAASYYKTEVKPSSELEVHAKQYDLQLKEKEFIGVNKAISDFGNDAIHVADKLAAINQYEAVLKSKCHKPDSLEERKTRREKELEGLKEVLPSMAGETMLLQLNSDSTRRLRGAQHHRGDLEVHH